MWNYILFWICYRCEIIRKYKYIFFSLFSIYLFVFQERIIAEQSLSFCSGIYISDNIQKITIFMSNKKKLFRFLFILLTISLLFLLIKQLPSVRIYEGENIYFHMISLIYKYGFSLFLLFFFSSFTVFCIKIIII
jgi:hypothetical protein